MKIKSLIVILALGFILRVLISAVSYHPDAGIVSFTSKEILREQRFDIYKVQDPGQKEVPDDLPLQYWIRVPLEILTRPFINTSVEDEFLTDSGSLLGKIDLNLHLALVKFPLIVFDLILGVLLAWAVAGPLRRKTLIFWMLNPVTLWATAAVGQVDILPTLFVVLSLIFLQKEKSSLAALSLGMGGAMKSFPFLLVPFLLISAKNWTERVKVAVLSVLPLALSVAPYLNSSDFRQNALFAPQLDKMLFAKLPLSGGEALIISVGLLILLYLLYSLKRRTSEDFLAFSTAALLAILAFTHFHIQWFLWVTPFLVIYLVRGVKRAEGLSLALVGAGVLLMLFLFEASLQVRLFAPLFPQLAEARGLAEILRPEQLGFGKNLAATLFAAGALFFAGSLLHRRQPEDE